MREAFQSQMEDLQIQHDLIDQVISCHDRNRVRYLRRWLDLCFNQTPTDASHSSFYPSYRIINVKK